MSRITRAQMEASPETTAAPRSKTCTPRSAGASISARQVLTKLAPDLVSRRLRLLRRLPNRQLAARACEQASAAARTLSFTSRASTTCSSTAPSAAIRFAASQLSATSRAARAWPCIRKAAPTSQNLMYEVERRIEVEWARAAGESFHVRMVVHTDDRAGMLNQLTQILFDEDVNIRSVEAHADERSSSTPRSSK